MKGVNSLGRISGGIPGPSSSNSILTDSPTRLVRTTSVPPRGRALRAFWARFRTTRQLADVEVRRPRRARLELEVDAGDLELAVDDVD